MTWDVYPRPSRKWVLPSERGAWRSVVSLGYNVKGSETSRDSGSSQSTRCAQIRSAPRNLSQCRYKQDDTVSPRSGATVLLGSSHLARIEAAHICRTRYTEGSRYDKNTILPIRLPSHLLSSTVIRLRCQSRSRIPNSSTSPHRSQ